MKPYLQALSAFVLGFIAIATIAAVQSTARFPSIEIRDFLTIIGGPSTTNHIGGNATVITNWLALSGTTNRLSDDGTNLLRNGVPIAGGTNVVSVSGGDGVTVTSGTNVSANLLASTNLILTTNSGIISYSTTNAPVFQTSVSTPFLTSPSSLSITPASGSNVSVNFSSPGWFAVNTNGLVVTNGNIGINTGTPLYRLHVVGTNTTGYLDAVARFYSSSTKGMWMGYNTAGNMGLIGAVTDGVTHDNLGIAPSGGNVGVGMGLNAPANLLTVSGAASVGLGYRAIAAPSNGLIVEGVVGIGTATPLAKLSVIGGANIGSTTDPGANNLNVVGTTTVGTSVSTPTITSDSNLSIAPAVGSNTVFTFSNPGTFTINTNWFAITNGHVGIGRIGPVGAVSGEQLTIQGSGNTGFLVASTGTGTPRIYFRSVPGGTPTSEMGTASHHRLDFTMNTTPRMSIAPTTGNVGVNTTTPLARLAINGGVHVGGDSDPGDNNLEVDGTTTTATLQVSGTAYVNDLYATNDVSALTFTDRSDSPNTIEEAYRIVLSHTPKDGRVDHSELDPLAWGRDQSRRNMSMVMSAQSMVIQDLMKRLAKLENNENN